MSASPDVRWKQRFQNFDRAFVLLRESLERGPAVLSPLEKEGVVQRFEYCFELAWKTMKDYLEAGGFVFAMLTPKQILKVAFAAKLIVTGSSGSTCCTTVICFPVPTAGRLSTRR